MQTDEGGSTPDAAPQHDPYAKGGDWPIERLVEDWALDPAALRRTLNFAAHSARLAQPPADEASSADLDAIANAAAKLVAALESASIGSVTNVMLRNLDLHPGDVLNHPEAHRTQIVNCVRWLRTRSRQAARQLKTLQTKPGGKSRFKESRRAHTGPRARPSERERSVIYIRGF